LRRRASALLLAVVVGGCAPTSANVASLAGEWQGRIVTARGHTAARLLLGADGRYEGTAFFDGADRPLHGMLVALPSGRLRYVGSEGDGTVTLEGETLRLRGDDGATGGVFHRTGP
jgi:hypothetical protein